ncbi:MAG: PfkB family carbohydrate kinase, partial [Armatimonadota bacterium]
MADVVTLGEAMLRLSPPDFHRLEQANSFDAKVGGGELNVAVGCSRLGLSSAWVSKLPQNPIGKMVRNKAREHGVDISNIVWDKGGRVGIYFLEFGAN